MTKDERVRMVMTVTASACAVAGVLLVVYGQFAGEDGDLRTRDVRDEATLAGFYFLIGAAAGALLAYRNGIRVMMLILLAALSTLIFMLFGLPLLEPWPLSRGEATVIGAIAAVSGAVTLAVYVWIVWQIVSRIIAMLTGPKADGPPPPLPPP